MLIDTHCHLDKPRYRQNMKNLLKEAEENNVKGVLIPSTQRNTIDVAQTLAQSYKGVFYAVGFHPKYANSMCQTLNNYFYSI